MKVIKRDDELFQRHWRSFVEREQVGPFYDLKYLCFLEDIVGESLKQKASFLVVDEEYPVCLCPVIIEEGEYGNQISSRNSFLPSYVLSLGLSYRKKKRIVEIAQDLVKGLAVEYKVSLQKSLIDTLSFVERCDHYNWLIEEGYLDCSINTSIIDLTQGTERIWQGIRKSYKSVIHQGEGNFEVALVDHNTGDRGVFAEFENLYLAAAGKRIYNKSSWDILYDLVKMDKAILLLIREDSRCIGGGFFQHENGKIYYSLGANHPDWEKELDIGHLYLWSAIKYYIERGFNYFEIGWQNQTMQLLNQPSEKEQRISFFKRGFGGGIRPLFMGIKFYNSDVGRTYIRAKMERFFEIW